MPTHSDSNEILTTYQKKEILIKSKAKNPTFFYFD